MKRRFRKLVDQHRHRIYTFAYYHLGNREEAEDVSQEVLMRMWKNWEEVEPATLPAWITRVTRNACIDALRKRTRYQAMVIPEEDCEASVRSAADRGGQETVLDAIDIRERLEKALSALEEPYRAIVILREIQGMTYEEISEVLDIPLGTIKVYLHRGRRKLRRRLVEGTV
ncbi:MAG: sigma-70 family RNA polymerase sigma factor [Candidatus Latescibacteria bacterium]|nr:sigma-70 family RNA polymerase sigma factor [Candidatus Latescibacterota bacterium]NIO00967.1 sigma-70 family RNA polymerase sigma factor [Candidatus Latescibacterota bacterium]NIO27366.1 sigma-70 family RNA polymerase sigma factor [Candidatus Latescibacterota bacterium]NIO54888.1 sigma-70 family RNA polymerase sigma factor [Candidatus Latescibacterota bacterium]NIT00977.1 sigma-70 family RNA polymerase sigma factor [Candidatus Latescibacterota bacterium]